ncbi:DarT1-associated NADAR antitoxin family protein [Avibacterium avium]|uniref:DarT1-associated NADAR antitoxin family protein n=1 Tax=Avibacterium avium TaxID=751 RepID=UPI003BF7BF17
MENKSIGKSIRPIFIPNRNDIGVIEREISFDWHMGMSREVRKRSINSLHNEARKQGFSHILEASSKSEQDIGIQLSAFFLKNIKGYPVENLFQSSKVFEKGGPFRDLLTVTPREAKKDERLRKSGNLIKFTFNKKIIR